MKKSAFLLVLAVVFLVSFEGCRKNPNKPAPSPPHILKINAPKSLEVKKSVTISASVEDSDTKLADLNFSWTPSEGVIQTGKQNVLYTAPDKPAKVKITLIVKDPTGLSASSAVTIEIVARTEPKPNQPPKITKLEAFKASLEPNQPTEIYYNYEDSDDNFSALQKNWTATDGQINDLGDKAVYTAPDQEGLFKIILAVADAHSNSTSATLAISVKKIVVPSPGQIVILIEQDVKNLIDTELLTYEGLIKTKFNKEIFADTSKNWSATSIADIRAYLKNLYETKHIEGAIMAGKIPFAIYQHGDGMVNIAPLYYEDFEMEWKDTDSDGLFEEKVINPNNPTEIWTAWWVPPIYENDAATVANSLKGFLQKCIKFHSGQLTGDECMIGYSDELGIGYAEGFKNMICNSNVFTQNEVQIISGDYAGFVGAWKQKVWKLCHIVTHGLPNGFYFKNGYYTVPEYTAEAQSNIGAVIVTSSACLSGNIMGSAFNSGFFPYSIALQMCFNAQSPTIAFYGSASSQSTGGVPAPSLYTVSAPLVDDPAYYHDLLFRGMKETYIADGFYQMRNSDIVWGSDHYMYRTNDDKTLIGDPFANLR